MYQNQYDKTENTAVSSTKMGNTALSSSAKLGFITLAMLIPCGIADSEYHPSNKDISVEQLYNSGPMMMFYSHSTDKYVRTQYEQKIDKESDEMQKRFRSMKHSFARYSEGFPAEKQVFFTAMANALCKLDFRDNVTSYNTDDASIDTILKLSSGLTLSISCFIDEDTDSPMVFSLHRGTTLLVTDEMPVEEIVRKINSVTA
jgi:hypothetical protein